MRHLYHLLVAVASVTLVLNVPHTANAKWKTKKSKNILFISADDLGRDALGLYPEAQHDVPPTPAIDSLAANGVTFDRAYAQPACSPTRATIMSGKFGFRTGVLWPVNRGSDLDVNDPELLPKILRSKGYATAMVGKYHLSNGDNTPDPQVEPNLAGFDYYAGSLGGFTDYFDWDQTIQGVTAIQPNFATTENVDRARDFILASEAEGTPWFVSLNFAAPHFPYTTPPPELVDDSVKAQVEDAVGSGWTYQENYEASGALDSEGLRIRRAVFHALISAMDTELGRLLVSAVDMENTCIIFIGDNGNQGNVPFPNFNVVVDPFDPNKAKVTLYEGGIKVPMVVCDPDIRAPGRVTNALVNTVDIYATILKTAGCPRPNRFDGKHFTAVLMARNNNVSVRRFVYADQAIPFASPFPFDGQTIQNHRYKVILYKGVPEFYDLLEDPFEENDLLLGDLSIREKLNYNWLLNKLDNLLSSEHEGPCDRDSRGDLRTKPPRAGGWRR